MAALQPPITVVGAGRVGGSLAALWYAKGLKVQAVYSRSSAHARRVAKLCVRTARRRTREPKASTDMATTARAGRWILVSVPDDDLAQVVTMLARTTVDWKGRIVLHTSGYHSAGVLSQLAELGAQTGTLHPLQSIPSIAEGIKRIPGSSFALSGSTGAISAGRKLARAAGGKAFVLEDNARALYHASAVIASNALVALADTALETLTSAGVPAAAARAALIPLMRGTIDNIEALSTVKALTGPAQRGDLGTVEGHLAALDTMARPTSRTEPGAAEVYTLMSRRMLGIAARGGALTSSHMKIGATLLKRTRTKKR